MTRSSSLVRVPLGRIALCVVLAILAWPREATLGTYGSYTLVRRGYTVAKDITVGSYSDHTREDIVFRQEEAEIGDSVKPHTAAYDKWFERVFTQKHPYADWLAALDRSRATPVQWDYKSRLPGPVWREAPADPNRVMPLKPYGGGGASPHVYLHMKADTPEVARGRALVGFALAQIAIGDTQEYTLHQADREPLPQRIEYAARADSFAGQPRLVATLLLEARTRQAELAKIVADKAQTADVRMLARLCQSALRHEPLVESDWQLLREVKSADIRTLWTWMLIFVPAAEQPAREAALRQQLPLPKDYDSYYREYVQGKRE